MRGRPARDLRRARGALLWQLALALLVLGCAPEAGPATQIVVTIEADETMAQRLTRVGVETYDPEALAMGARAKPAGSGSFALPSDATVPFSFGIAKQRAARFLLVVRGYEGQRLVIEQKGILAFRTGETRGVHVYLASVCRGVLCGEGDEDWLERTCSPMDEGACRAIEDLPTVVVEPGKELEAWEGGVAQTDAGADMDADVDAEVDPPRGDASFDGGPPDVDAANGPAIDAEAGAQDGGAGEGGELAEGGPDGEGGAATCASLSCPANATCAVDAGAAGCLCNSDYRLNASGGCDKIDDCAGNPCGAGNTCNDGTLDYTCTCASATHFQADAKRCVPKFQGIGGGHDHVCAFRTDGSVVCWGDNEYGQLARTAGLANFATTPVVIAGLSDATGVTGGVDHTCVLRNNGMVVCFGLNDEGQLGSVTANYTIAPTLVTGLANATAVRAGLAHTCALRNDDTVVCWGNNTFGQLGSTGVGRSSTPLVVSGLTAVRELAAGGDNVCALRMDQTAVCWGLNRWGQLGNNLTGEASAPATFGAALGEVGVGRGHICALRSAAPHVGCAGQNTSGQLGDGTNTDAHVPVYPANALAAPTRLALGQTHSCALNGNGEVYCWGANDLGQLGNGTTTNSNTPVKVQGLSGVVDIVAGRAYSCALRNDGNISCWGTGHVGRLGNGATADSSTPVTVRAY